MASISHDQSRSTIDASQSRARRVKNESSKRAQQLQGQLETAKEREVVVKDPDDSSIDRTPHPLTEKDDKPQTVARRSGAAAGASTASGADRRISVATGGEGSSVSGRGGGGHSQSDDRSQSHMDSGSSSSEQTSTWTPDDDSSSNPVTLEESSESQSQSVSDRSSIMRRQSNASTSTERPGDQRAGGARGGGDDRAQEPAKPKEWTPDELKAWRQQEVVITLSETPVMHLFERHDELVATDDKEATAVKKRNERYEQFCQSRKGGEAGGRYAERGVATFTRPGFGVVTELPLKETSDRGAHVTTWKLYDELKRTRLAEDEEAVQGKGDASAEAGAPTGTEEDNQAASGPDEDAGDADDQAEGGGDPKRSDRGGKKHAAWMSSPSLLLNVMAVERCVVMNNFEELQLAYRGIAMEALRDHLPPEGDDQGSGRAASKDERASRRRDYRGGGLLDGSAEPGDKEQEAEKAAAAKAEAEAAAANAVSKAKIRVLWRYGGDMFRGMSVSSLAWNQRNSDLLAVGYGRNANLLDNGGDRGVVACWSLKNPVAPERVINVESEAGVSALHFSKQRPSLLAVGSKDGTLAIYDVRKHGHSPILRSTVNTGQHTGTVWEVRWVQMDENRDEALMTISADGRVTEWSIKKNSLERTTDLMHLKRVPNREHDAAVALVSGAATKKGVVKEAVLSRQSGGMCFDVNPRDAMTYVVGTEDGTLHKCSKSTNESYVLDYNPPHSEPVYRVRWSRFRPDFFVTCSADWTSRLYHTDVSHYLLRFENNRQDAVQDLSWSPTQSTVFATCTAQGNVDVWDLFDPLQPKVSLPLPNRVLNTVLFADHDAMILATGDSSGEVTVAKLFGHEFEREGTDEQQSERFVEAVRRNVAADVLPANL